RETPRTTSMSPYPHRSRSTFNSGVLSTQVSLQHTGIAAHHVGRPLGQPGPLAHDDDGITQVHHQVHVVLNKEKGDATLPVQLLDPLPQAAHEGGIHSGGGL